MLLLNIKAEGDDDDDTRGELPMMPTGDDDVPYWRGVVKAEVVVLASSAARARLARKILLCWLIIIILRNYY